MTKLTFRSTLVLLFLALPFAGSWAGDKVKEAKYAEAIEMFKGAGESAGFFGNSYGYAVFPTVGKGGLGIGGGYGKGRVYAGGKHVGDTSIAQLTLGLQAGGQAYSMIIFLQDRRAFDEFTSGNFEFGAEASAVAIKAAAGAEASTAGAAAGTSAEKGEVTTAGAYHKGMAVFTAAKGGLMAEATIGGSKFSYTPK